MCVREVVLDSWQLILPFLVAVVVAAVSTPMVSLLARQIGAVDRPNERKVNRRTDMPLLGGIAVALGCSVSLATAVIGLEWGAHAITQIEGFLIGGCLLLIIGVFDDRWKVSVWSKLGFQILAAADRVWRLHIPRWASCAALVAGEGGTSRCSRRIDVTALLGAKAAAN